MPQPQTIVGLTPIVGPEPGILVLGSMPSVTSIEKQQYYGHPRNAFWPIMAHLLGFEKHRNYADNVTEIEQRGIAIWDVIGECVRPGSLDSAIVRGSERINPVPDFLSAHDTIRAIALNGGTAASLFKRYIRPALEIDQFDIYTLPSTSPANAGMDFASKCLAWRSMLESFPPENRLPD